MPLHTSCSRTVHNDACISIGTSRNTIGGTATTIFCGSVQMCNIVPKLCSRSSCIPGLYQTCVVSHRACDRLCIRLCWKVAALCSVRVPCTSPVSDFAEQSAVHLLDKKCQLPALGILHFLPSFSCTFPNVAAPESLGTLHFSFIS